MYLSNFIKEKEGRIMVFRCNDCGHIFDEGEEYTWQESRGEFWGSS